MINYKIYIIYHVMNEKEEIPRYPVVDKKKRIMTPAIEDMTVKDERACLSEIRKLGPSVSHHQNLSQIRRIKRNIPTPRILEQGVHKFFHEGCCRITRVPGCLVHGTHGYLNHVFLFLG